MHKLAVVSRQTPSPPQLYLTSFSHGTRVTVRDLFGNMPVRVKQRAMSAEKQRENRKEWEELRREVVLLLLAWPKGVAVTVRKTGTSEKLSIPGYTSASISVSGNQVYLAAVCSILSQATLISIEDKPFWVSARASTPKIAIIAAISLLPSATKHTQFISFGIQPLVSHDAHSLLHDEINRIFLNSAFGNDEEVVDLDASELDRRSKDKRYKRDSFTNKELKGGKKGIDRWPMFYINIQQNLQSINGKSLDMDAILDDKGSSLSTIMELLQAMIWEFLTKHHFRPKANHRRRVNSTANGRDANYSGLEVSDISPDSPESSRPKNGLQSTKRTVSGPSPLKPRSMAARSKPPSLQQDSSRVDTPFDVWTRVKIGSRPAKFAIAENVQQTSNAANITRPFSAPPNSMSQTAAPTPSNISVTPLLSSKGEIIRRPFEEVARPGVEARKTIALTPGQTKQLVPEHHEDPIEQGKNMIAWTNPVTKVKSLVNPRTGLTVPVDKARSTNSNSVTKPRTEHQKPTKNNILATERPSPWLSDILRSWNNPVFRPAETSIPQITFDGLEVGTQEILHGRHHQCSQTNIKRAFKQSSTCIDGQISKAALGQAEVVSQVDNKFILVKLASATSTRVTNVGDDLLVLIDQHAADERIRIETLLEDFFAPLATGTSMPTESSIRTSLLDRPINIEISLKESRLLYKYKEYFTRWGIIFDLPNNVTQPEPAFRPTAMQRLTVRFLPPGIMERCKLDPRMLIDLIRTEAWKIHGGGTQAVPAADGDWLHRIHNCPQGIIDMLNSRACRSAIMFNDELSKEQCQSLVRRLASCKFPFQCAHGRPSLVPLVDLGRIDMCTAKQNREELFGEEFNKWRENMK